MAAGAKPAHQPGVEVAQRLADRLVQRTQRQERSVARPRQDEPLHVQHRDLDLAGQSELKVDPGSASKIDLPEHPRAHLAAFRGILQADGYAGYGGLYERGVTEAACWAHVRRKFFDLHAATGAPPAQDALHRIAALYAIEVEIRGQPPDARLAARAAQSAPLFSGLKEWLDNSLGRISGKSPLAGAIRYTLSRWDALTLGLRDGRACLDNNAAERTMRPITLGRKNWLFAGSNAGGERAAAVYTLTETAKLNALDPRDYLHQVLGRIADHPVRRVHELLPWNLAGIRMRLDQRSAA